MTINGSPAPHARPAALADNDQGPAAVTGDRASDLLLHL